MSSVNSIDPDRNISLAQIYTAPAIIIGLSVAWLIWVVSGPHYSVPPKLLIAPMATLFSLMSLVWFIMVVVRNLAFIRGYTTLRYFSDFKSDAPADDRLERPARTFNNIMQVPMLFFIICILILVEKEIDNAQVVLA